MHDHKNHERETGPSGDPHPHDHEHHHKDAHGPGHDHGSGHAHLHGVVSPEVASSNRGLWAIKWSFVVLFVTAVLQIIVFYFSNSVGLLADTIHNFADAGTAIPLGIAFLFTRLKPTARFSYGYGRVEDLAGMAVVLTISASAVVAAYESIYRLIHPEAVGHLGAVAAASIIGFLGNEGVAIFRLRVGKEIGSAALVADGQHARVDGWTSLAVLFGAIGVWLGYPKSDPIVGLLITIAILFIAWDATKAVFTRVLDGVEPEILEQVRQIASSVPGVRAVSEVRARWVGHRLNAEVNLAADSITTVAEAHRLSVAVHDALTSKIVFLSRAVIHVDPSEHSGESFHTHL